MVGLSDFKGPYKCMVTILLNVLRLPFRKYLKEGQTSISLHPGWCQTDMGGKSAPLTEEDGARRINKTIWME